MGRVEIGLSDLVRARDAHTARGAGVGGSQLLPVTIKERRFLTAKSRMRPGLELVNNSEAARDVLQAQLDMPGNTGLLRVMRKAA